MYDILDQLVNEKYKSLNGLIETVDNFKQHKLSILLEQILVMTVKFVSGEAVDITSEGYDRYQHYLKHLPAIKLSPHLIDKLKHYNQALVLPNKKSTEKKPAKTARPYQDYETEAKLVRNIKDLINALYLLKVTFADLETLDIREGKQPIFQWQGEKSAVERKVHDALPFWQRWFYETKESVVVGALTFNRSSKLSYSVLKKLYTDIVPEAYEASKLLTHVDFSVLEAFIPEYQFISTELEKLSNLSGQLQQYMDLTPAKIRLIAKPERLGDISGRAINQLSSEEGALELGFLTQMSASLPKHFQEFSQTIQALNPDLSKVESSVSPQQFHAFEHLAEKILIETDRLRRRHVLTLPLYVLNYARLLQNIVTMGTGIVEHFSLANETSKQVVVQQLQWLKYQSISEFIVLADKIEIEFMLAPGALSGLWLNHLENYWQAIAGIVDKFADLRRHNPDLLYLNSSGLLQVRQNAIDAYFDNCEIIRHQITRQRQAFKQFYAIVARCETQHSLSETDRTNLANNYKHIQHLVIARLPDVHATIVDEIVNTKAPRNKLKNNVAFPVTNRLSKIVWVWENCRKALLDAKTDLSNDMISTENTCELRQQIVGDVQTSLAALSVKMPLLPWQKLSLKRNAAINPETRPKHPYDQCLIAIYHAEQDTRQLEHALKAYLAFRTQLNTYAEQGYLYINQLSNPEKRSLSLIYAALQPHFFHCFTDTQIESWRYFDRKMIQALTGDSRWLPQDSTVLMIKDVLRQLSIFQVATKLVAQKKTTKAHIDQLYKALSGLKTTYGHSLNFVESHKALERSDYVFKWPFVAEIPKWVQEKRGEFWQWLVDKYGQSDYELEFIPESGIDSLFVKPGKVYLSERHNYVVKDLNKDVVYEGKLDSDIDLRDLKRRLRDPALIDVVLNFTTKKGHTLPLFTSKQGLNRPMLIKKIGEMRTSGVPYPEIEDRINRLREPFQLLVLKQIFNAFYYLEMSAKQLADLREDDYQTWYVTKLLKAFRGVDQLYLLGTTIFSDENLWGYIAEIKKKFNDLNISQHYELYAKQPDLVLSMTEAQPIQYTGIWYLIQALNVMPYHLRQELESKRFDSDLFDMASVSAKNTCLEIESLLDKSDSYVKIFLALPQVSRLCFQLRDETIELGKQVHRAIASNLSNLFHGQMTNLLIEADKIEAELGVKPGIISERIRQVITRFFVRFLFQQKLPSDKIFSILHANDGKLRRLTALINKKESVFAEADKVDAESELVDKTTDPELAAELDGKDASLFLLLENLDQLQKFLTSERSEYAINIKAERDQYVKLFIKMHFSYLTNRYLKRISGLGSLSVDYRKQFLNTLESKYIQLETDILTHYSDQLEEQNLIPVIHQKTEQVIAEFFDSEHKPYILLSGFLHQLYKFREYCSKISDVQDMDSIPDQNYQALDSIGIDDLIDELETVARNDRLPASQRIDELRVALQNTINIGEENYSFKQEVDKLRMNPEQFTWLWLKQCLIDLLCFLKLKTPSHQKQYDQLCQNLVEPRSPMQNLYERNGFFKLRQDMRDETDEPGLSGMDVNPVSQP